MISGRYPIGTTLPNDAELMADFEVSRTVLREALKTLEAKGLLEARPKVGTKVAKKSRWNLYDPQVLAWHLDAPPDAEFLAGFTRCGARWSRLLQPKWRDGGRQIRSA